MLALTLLVLLSLAFAAPLTNRDPHDLIPGKYIVKFKNDIHTTSVQKLKDSVAAPLDFEYSLQGFTGFAATLSDDELADLQNSDLIEFIEQDAKVKISALKNQYNATWGLARIAHRQPNCTLYAYDETAGAGTCVYVIDTGIQIDHPEFQGRAEFLSDTSGEDSFVDGMGHGTHVAGTIGSTTWGVAKKAHLFAVKVLDSYGDGTNAGVIAGIQFVADDAAKRREQCPNGIVSNMSLGGPKNAAVNSAAAALVSAGIFLAVAAGNEASSSQYSSPASEPSVCTVGATDSLDRLATWSNWGSGIDILAPGLNVTSTWNDGTYETISGTSMASPHVAGVAAYLLGLGLASENGLCDVIVGMATKNAVDLGLDQEGTPNLLLYNGAEEAASKRYGGARTH